MNKEIEVLNETLVEKIFSQFEKVDSKNIYTDDFIDEIVKLFKECRIYYKEIRGDYKEISAVYSIVDSYDYDYQITIYAPNREFNEKENIDFINTILHEFVHIIILKGILALPPSKKSSELSKKFTKTIQLYGFDVDNVTSEKCTNFLSYIFDMTERVVFAFSIAYCCYFNKQNSQILYELNKEIIVNFSNKKINKLTRDRYIDSLRDDKLFLFKIQYAVYFLNKQYWNIKLVSFKKLIKKYETRLYKLSERLV